MPILDKYQYLIVEDDEPKLNAILALVHEMAPRATVYTANSVSSAVKIISENVIHFSILDMSLPAFDIISGISSGGQPQGFGGRDILRFLEDTQPETYAIILTQYEEFKSNEMDTKSKKLAEISIEMKEEFGAIICGVLYYSGRRGDWRESIKNILKNKIGEDEH